MASALRRRFRRKEERPGVVPENEGKVVIGEDVYRFFPLPDGERVILWSSSRYQLCLFSIRTGECLHTYTHAQYMNDIVLLDNDVFASVSVRRFIVVHRISDGTELGRFEYSANFGPSASLGNGRFLVGTAKGDVLEMQWSERRTLTHIRTVGVGPGPIREISTSGNRFAIRFPNDVRVFEIASLERVEHVQLPEENSCIHLTDLFLAIGCANGEIFVRSAITLELVCEMQNHSDRVESVHVMADTRHLLSGGKDGLVCIQDIETGAPLWQQQFNTDVRLTTPLSDTRLLTWFQGSLNSLGGSLVVHNLPQDLAEVMIPPSPPPLRDALDNSISGAELPGEKCKQLITFERCRSSFDEWCCAHHLLMMAVQDRDIPRSRDYNGEISWWFENLYLAAKDVEMASLDDVRAMKRFLMEAKAIGVVEGIEPVLAAIRLTQDLKAEVRALQRADILMLERVLSIEARLDKLKEAFKRYRRYMRNSQLLGVALQIIPIAGGSVAGALSVGADVLEGLSVKDLTDYFLGLGSNVLLDEMSSMGERVFNRAAQVLRPEILEKMNAEHRRKLEEEVRRCGLSLSELRELFLERARHTREIGSEPSPASVGITDQEVVGVVIEEAEYELKPRILEIGNSEDASPNATSVDVENENSVELATGEETKTTTQPNMWNDFEFDREEIRAFSQEKLASLWAAYIVRNDDARHEEYEELQDCLVVVLKKEHLFVELVVDSSAVPSEELIEAVTNGMVENGVRMTTGIRGKVRKFVFTIRGEN